ncbi:MAG: polysaccharide lyase family protein [Chitinophagaceae bacterium]
MKNHSFCVPVLAFCTLALRLPAQVNIKENDSSVILQNGFASFSFDKQSADLKTIAYRQYDNVLGAKGSAYLSGPDFGMRPSTFTVTTSSRDMIDISFLHKDKNHFEYDLHYVVRSGVKGIYVYLIEKHSANSTGIYGQTRWGLRADPALFDNQLVRDSIQGPMYAMDSLEVGSKIQDWTYRMHNGIIYTKYDYADYIDGRYVHGMYGRESHLGLFVIQASHEYLNGGPTKQYMTTHSSPYLICMFNCSHFLANNRVADDTVTGNWEKLNGPFLLYLNHEKDAAASWQDAKREADAQKASWPFAWLQQKAYPRQRSILNITAKDEKDKHLPDITFVLADSAHDWQAQSLGYIFSGHTNPQGQLSLPDIRPGRYTLYGFGGDRIQQFRKDGIVISPDGKDQTLSAILPDESSRTIWEIGVADRFTKGFHYSTHPRAYGLFDSVPAQLDYTIGKNQTSDWYYAQTREGVWNIHFGRPSQTTDSLVLYIALAGAAKNPHAAITLNGHKIGELKNLGNDASVYRSAILGGYYRLYAIPFSSSLLTDDNTFGIDLLKCPNGGGLMYDAIRLASK